MTTTAVTVDVGGICSRSLRGRQLAATTTYISVGITAASWQRRTYVVDLSDHWTAGELTAGGGGGGGRIVASILSVIHQV